MAGPRSNNNQFNSQMYLSPGQQDLLMAALNSNNAGKQNALKPGQDFQPGSDEQKLAQSFPMDGINPAFFDAAQQNGFQDYGAVNFDGIDDSPYVDFLDGDPNFDFDSTLNGDSMIGDLPGANDDDTNDNEASEKRKSPEDDDEDGEGGGKRREGEDKTAKKPGRKPLTSEPTTKRKAQNRAAQRAFRERKEKHLKDLESKVAELEKASDAANHENGLLRAQVSRLQTELREYRKRMSSNSSGINRPQAGNISFMSGMNGGNTNFQFEFPRFGGLPGAHILNGSLGKPSSPSSTGQSVRPGVSANSLLGRQNSGGRSLSPKSQSNGLGSPDKNVTSPQESTFGSRPNGSGSIASPPLFGNMTGSPFESGNSPDANGNRGRTDSSSGHSRVFQFNSGSNSTTDSPSASSVSQYGPNSSCGTSPEPSHNSPTSGKADGQLDPKQGYVCHGNSEGEITFCEKLNMACGNPRNPVPRAMSRSNGTPANTGATNAQSDNSGLDFLSTQNGGQFDPTLFGDYRDPQAAIVGDGDFTGGFFDDAFNFNYGSPFNFGDGASPAVTANKTNSTGDKVKAVEGADDEVVPADNMDALLNCHKIWDKLAQRPDFKDGTIDIDNLCTELRAKARCSESGVVVDNKDVEAALKRLPEANR